MNYAFLKLRCRSSMPDRFGTSVLRSIEVCKRRAAIFQTWWRHCCPKESAHLKLFCVVIFSTRMHSSRMRTGRTLTVFRWRTPPPPKKIPPPKDTPPQNTPPPPPEKLEQNLEHPPPKIRAISGAHPPPLWTEWMTDACENITLAKTSFRPVTILSLKYFLQRIEKPLSRDIVLYYKEANPFFS